MNESLPTPINPENLEARARFEIKVRRDGNLNEEEIKRLGDYEFDMGPDTVGDQIDRYIS